MSKFFWPEQKFHVEKSAKKSPSKGDVRGCAFCGLDKDCLTPKMKATGKGEKGIFILAEAPGKTEDEKGIQLIGKAGQLLRKKLKKFGIDLDIDCRKMNAVNCRPERNRTPSSNEIACCRVRVLKEIRLYRPKLIILLGGPAVESIIGCHWKRNLGGITIWRGWTIPDRNYRCWICPTYHPAFVQRNEKNPACELIFEQDLEKALSMLNIPFPKFKPIEDGIRITQNSREAICYLRNMLSHPPEISAFDFECTGLKPQLPEQRIVSCSIATDPDSATAFLTDNKIVVSLLKRYLTNERIKKIGANIKFEHSWAAEKYGVDVQGWVHDVCLAQHISDNRQGICSVKFMSYVFEGVADYDSHISGFLSTKSKSGNALNKIDKIPIDQLLMYNAIDSKMEFSIAMKQMENIV